LSFPKIILIGSVILFVAIVSTKYVKKHQASSKQLAQAQAEDSRASSIELIANKPYDRIEALPKTPVVAISEVEKKLPLTPLTPLDDSGFPMCDRIDQLFSTGKNRLPIVETITYSSNVSWLKGRPAWIGDYAKYYATSKHFIARSLNGKRDYLSQKVSPGQKFNVFRKDKNFQFHLLLDLSCRKMGLYVIDLDSNERTLLKTYSVAVGRLDDSTISGSLTPLGRFSLDGKIAVNKPGDMGFFQDQKIEIVTVFGTRWIPLNEALGGATSSVEGIGLQGAPWIKLEDGNYAENRNCIGNYVTGGCIRLYQEDIEELFSIIITKPAVIEIVRDFREAQLPGIENPELSVATLEDLSPLGTKE
jgi:hypothetical protein